MPIVFINVLKLSLIIFYPNWPEIKDALLPGQTAQDRPDLVARAFREKIRMILSAIFKNGAFGKCRGIIYTIEFQKRGLPHVHILIFLEPDSRYLLPPQIDTIISAQLPDPQTQSPLFDLVSKFMIHGPCGGLNPQAPCMKDNKCTKGYPKSFCEETLLSQNGYITYARPNNGRTCKKKVNGVDVDVDNRWVVPHNPWLILQLKCHANLECCVSIQSCKYLHKYIYKGHDCTTDMLGSGKQHKTTTKTLSSGASQVK